MTIAITLSIDDGIVFSADSASTFVGAGGTVANVYFNAEKIFNLVKGLPIGAATYGVGNIEGRSISSLAKDLREELENPTTGLDPSTYTIESVARHVERFFFTERYSKIYPLMVDDANGMPQPLYAAFGFVVAGFSANNRKAEMWSVAVETDAVVVSQVYAPGVSGLTWRGQPEAITRLVRGFSNHLVAKEHGAEYV